MGQRRSPLHPLLGLAGLLLCGLVLASCGSGQSSTSVVEGQPVTLGGLRYNVLFTRFLNPNDPEDAAYLRGHAPPSPGNVYLGTFLQVKNVGNNVTAVPSTFTVSDTQHDHFRSLPSHSDFAFPGGIKLASDDTVPIPDSPAASGPIQGSLVLFELPYAATANTPLTLAIPGRGGPAEVELDI
jgi:hypothetical protein